MAELSQHPDVVDLAEYAEGLVDDSRRAAVEDHVRGCPDCSQTLSDLTALPAALAAAPLPPLPTDVADRLDRAIAAESEARASGWSGTAAAQVAPLRPKRRWLAPVVAAAAVVGAVAIAVPVLNSESGSDDSATEMSTGAESSSEDEGGAQDIPDSGPPVAHAPSAERSPAELTSDSFGRDVIDAFYTGSRELRMSQRSQLTSEPDTAAGYYTSVLDELSDPCGEPTVSGGTVDDVTYDGDPAFLLRQESGRTVDAIAYSCAGDTPTVLDTVTLRPRS